MNWHIGQRIVVIKDHSKGIVKTGQEFVIKNIRESICDCHDCLIDIGFIGSPKKRCRRCGSGGIIPGNALWLSNKLFAPIETQTELSEYTSDNWTEIVEPQKELA